MRPSLFHPIRLAALASVAMAISSVAHAQYAVFADPNDTILVPGNTVVQNAFTMEARIWLFDSAPVGGRIYTEQFESQEDKGLLAEAGAALGYAYTGPSYLAGGLAPYNGPLCPNRWHHIAFVRDGGNQRLYVDGELVVSHPWAASVLNSSASPRAIGAFQYTRGGPFGPAMRGLMDYVRISDTVRYSGGPFAPPLQDDLSVDVNTLLFYKFDEGPGSTMVVDSSMFGFTGTLGVGFPGATAPTFTGAEPLHADLNNDGHVDAADLGLLLSVWGGSDCAADLDHSGGVNAADLGIVLAAWSV